MASPFMSRKLDDTNEEHLAKRQCATDQFMASVIGPPDDGELEVEKIVGIRPRHGAVHPPRPAAAAGPDPWVEYQVRWKGFGPEDDTWETERTLSKAQSMLQGRRAELLVTDFLTSDFGTPFLKVSNEKYSYFHILSMLSSRYFEKRHKMGESRERKKTEVGNIYLIIFITD